jgi:hypothetical protein
MFQPSQSLTKRKPVRKPDPRNKGFVDISNAAIGGFESAMKFPDTARKLLIVGVSVMVLVIVVVVATGISHVPQT